MFSGHELTFAIRLLEALVAGVLIGSERELRDKPAGISTHCLVIGGAMVFAFLSQTIEAANTARMAAQIVTGVGFLGAGIILRRDDGSVANLTTAASVWQAAAVGMLIGFGFHLLAAMATVYSVIVPRIPHLRHRGDR